MRNKLKLVVALSSVLGLVACNSGSSNASPDNNVIPKPTPTPTPTPDVVAKPLMFQSVGKPLDLTKVGGNSVWYLKVTNTNDTKIRISSSNNLNQYFIADLESDVSGYEYDLNAIHPMQYIESYAGEVLGESSVPDCSSLVDNTSLNLLYPKLILNANQSCIFKFRAFYNLNTGKNSNQFTIKYGYDFASDNKVFHNSDLNDKNNIINYSISAMMESHSAESILGTYANSGRLSSAMPPIVSMAGNKLIMYKEYTNPVNGIVATSNVSIKNVSYDANNDKLSVVNSTDYNLNFDPRGSYLDQNFRNRGWISYNGENFGSYTYLNFTSYIDALYAPTSAVIGTKGNAFIQLGSGPGSYGIYTSKTGDFENKANYSFVSKMPNYTDIAGVDEGNQIALIYQNYKFYCYNMKNDTYKEFNSNLNGGDYSGTVNVGFQYNISVVNGSLYSPSDFGGNGEAVPTRGQNNRVDISNYYYSFKMKKVDTINCTLDSNVDTMLSGFETLKNTSAGYSLVQGKYIINSNLLK